MRKLLLCSPRGFCAGVVRAIQVVEEALNKWGAPIYVHHEIVHNRHVVEDLKEKGAVFVNSLSEVPKGAKVVYSAHGVSPQVRQLAQERALYDIDATCILVTKVHSAVKLYASRGFHILLIGKRDHVEVQGIYGEAPEHITIVENTSDVKALFFDPNTPLFYVTQTTLSLDDVADVTQALKERFPEIRTLPSPSVCYATQNRQDALKAVLPYVGFVYVIGDRQSSNSNSLKYIAERRRVPARLINHPDDIRNEILKYSGHIAMTAGASTPEHIVQACIHKLQELIPRLQIEEVFSVKEDISFQLPKKL